jgi:hypothetical protein
MVEQVADDTWYLLDLLDTTVPTVGSIQQPSIERALRLAPSSILGPATFMPNDVVNTISECSYLNCKCIATALSGLNVSFMIC